MATEIRHENFVNMKSKIVYTITDEAPMLATHSLLPIIKSFVKHAEIDVEIKDISLASRVLSVFPEYLNENQIVNDDLKDLGELVQKKHANIIKLPNISASIPQLQLTIKELRDKGFSVPVYPQKVENKDQQKVKNTYDQVKGSAVNPVLREGNSDRRAPKSVKNYVKNSPHSMGSWDKNSKTHVSTMNEGDFFNNERSTFFKNDKKVQIEFHDLKGNVTILKKYFDILKDEIIDVSFMSKNALLSFLSNEFCDAKKSNILLSLHLKATMMKVSDPIIFSHAVNTFFSDLLPKYKKSFDDISVDFKNGFGDLLEKIKNLSENSQKEILDDIDNIFNQQAKLAMVDSSRGITNLHVPSDIIIDASMPAMIRNSGKMWNSSGELEDTKAIIPDSSYACIYSAVINFCKKNGAFDPVSMGSVSNIGLMAQKAEEYGSHDKTFEISQNGYVKLIDENNDIIFENEVEKGDIWRMCQTKHNPIINWIDLAISRAKETNLLTIFWLDEKRSHDKNLILKIKQQLDRGNHNDLNIKILAPYDACMLTLEKISNGEDVISVTGNVLRDYLTDLFPILELGTSAKMLSIVPLMNGGGLFETGAGGSAPKHVQQFVNEGHLRWDSLGEYLALVVSLEHLSKNNNSQALILAKTLDKAIEKLLVEEKSPKRKAGQLDNRGSHFYLALYWAKFLSTQEEDGDLKNYFSEIYFKIKENEIKIIQEISDSQNKKVDINGYYFPDYSLVTHSMRPSKIFNKIIDSM